jgi:galactose mutarotase-like enzyme
MTPTSQTYIGTDGFERIVIQNDFLRCVYMPGLGGKIASIVDVRTNREWLWRHPRMDYAIVPSTASYVTTADTGGWDECFPTVGKCQYPADPWLGAYLADHGELWCQTPQTTVDTLDNAVLITTVWQGISLPYTFERMLRIDASNQMTLDYTVTNNGAAPMHWIWCAHPLMAIEPGMGLHTPEGTTFFRQDAQGNLIPEPAHAIRPNATQTLDLRVLPERTSGYGVKLYSEVLPKGWVSLRAANGSLSMEWDVREVPQLAIWFNAGAWSADGGTPYYNMGIEPAIGVYDPLSDAYTKTTTYGTLAPGQQRCWQVRVRIDADTKGA